MSDDVIEPGTGHNSATFAETLEKDPSIIFTDETALPALVAYLDNEILAHVPDLTTKDGRSAITKLKTRIVSYKTSLDELGKSLNEDARKQIDAIDKVRRKLRTDLDALRDRAAKPLTDWEEAEDRKKSQMTFIRTTIWEAGRITSNDTLHTLAARRAQVCALGISHELFGDQLDAVEAERQATLRDLDGAKVRIEQDEKDRAELAELRAQKAEKESRERLAKEAEDKAVCDAAIKEEADRQERERTAAAAKAAADRAVAAERAAAQAVIAEANRKAAEAEATLESERRAEAKRKADEIAAQARTQAAEDARKRDLEHRAKVIREAAEAITMEVSILAKDLGIAEQIVAAIVAGKIPHVRLDF